MMESDLEFQLDPSIVIELRYVEIFTFDKLKIST
jgi:hypothetical protein